MTEYIENPDEDPNAILMYTRNRHPIYVDHDDYASMRRFRWYRTPNGYIATPVRKSVMLLMHRMMVHAASDIYVDHINGIRYDNRRCNLRNATPSQNSANYHRQPATGYRGVVVQHSDIHRPYAMKFALDGRTIGRSFDNIEDAARCYDQLAWNKLGEFTKLNFPDDVEDYKQQKYMHLWLSTGTVSNKSGYRGVSPLGNSYSAKAYGQHLITVDDPEIAALVRDQFVYDHHAEYSYHWGYNFPDRLDEYEQGVWRL